MAYPHKRAPQLLVAGHGSNLAGYWPALARAVSLDVGDGFGAFFARAEASDVGNWFAEKEFGMWQLSRYIQCPALAQGLNRFLRVGRNDGGGALCLGWLRRFADNAFAEEDTSVEVSWRSRLAGRLGDLLRGQVEIVGDEG